MSAEKKFSLNLPLKVILTEEGASHFISHKIKLLRFRLADNIEENFTESFFTSVFAKYDFGELYFKN